MTKQHHVLLVEDNVPDIVLAQKALSILPTVDVTVAMSAESALKALEQLGADLLLLDLNLPKTSGFELLKVLKADPVLRRIPVVVVTSSSADDDILRAYDAGASGYMIKPLSLRQYRDMAGILGTYWLHTSKLPAR